MVKAAQLIPCTVLAFVGIGLPRAPSAVDYMPLETFELVLQADLIVDGVVAGIDGATLDTQKHNSTITLAVKEWIAGPRPVASVRVRQFANWACAHRYAPYAEGQRAVFFLNHARGEKGEPLIDQPLRVMSAGNEGECPIVGDDVLHLDWRMKDFPKEKRIAFGHEYFGLVTPRKDFVAAVRGLRQCFEWPFTPSQGKPNHPREAIHQTCSEAELAAFMESSAIARAMVHDSLEHEHFAKQVR